MQPAVLKENRRIRSGWIYTAMFAVPGISGSLGYQNLSEDKMIGWLTVAKAVLPHIADIVSAAGPVFTKRKNEDSSAIQPGVLQQQINELQSAAAQNTAYIKELASQLQTALAALEQGVLAADAKVKRVYSLCYIIGGISVVSLCLSLFALFGH
jgi:hypothetical protein